jgi:hypothetical protein
VERDMMGVAHYGTLTRQELMAAREDTKVEAVEANVLMLQHTSLSLLQARRR